MSSRGSPKFLSSDPNERFEVENGANIDWDSVTVVEVDVGDPQPSKLAPFCKAYNEAECLLSEHTCPHRHNCSACKEPGHSSLNCRLTSNKGPSASVGRGLVWEDDGETSFSPCSQLSLTADPLPDRPPPRLLPPKLVRTVEKHPDIFKVVTTLNVDAFEGLLRKHPNRPFVRSVVQGFRQGFWPFANVPRARNTVDESKGSTKKPEFRNFLEEQRDKEVEAERFSPSIGTKLLPGMTCMPVHVVKGSKKLRAIYDHSAGEHALNSMIPEEARAVKLDGLKHFGYVLRRARALAESKNIVLFKSDVSSAYRIIPMSPYWQALQAVKIDGQYHVDRCNTFGNAASQRLFCAFSSLVLWIAENVYDVHDMLSYIDDNFSWDYATQKKYYEPYKKLLPIKQARLLQLWDILGIPHDIKKQEHGHVLTIIGFEVDVRRMRVRIPKAALDKILPKIESLYTSKAIETTKTTVKDIRQIAGKVNWTIEVNPLLRPGVDCLYRLVTGRMDPKETCTIDEETQQNLIWLAKHLRKPNGISFMYSIAWSRDEATQIIYATTLKGGMSFYIPRNQLLKYVPFPPQLTTDRELSLYGLANVACAIEWASRGLGTVRKRVLIYVEDDILDELFKTLRAPAGTSAVLRFALDLLIASEMDLHVEKGFNEKAKKITEALADGRRDTVARNFVNIKLSEYAMHKELTTLLTNCLRRA